MGEHYTSGEVIQLLQDGSFGASRTLPGDTFIQAIRCYKATLCYALGGNTTASPSLPDELFPLNPTTGAVGTMATMSGFSGANLTCINATTCLVAGLNGTGSTAKNAVVAVVKGKPGKPANYPGTFGLRDVACASTSACYAVGASSSGRSWTRCSPSHRPAPGRRHAAHALLVVAYQSCARIGRFCVLAMAMANVPSVLKV